MCMCLCLLSSTKYAVAREGRRESTLPSPTLSAALLQLCVKETTGSTPASSDYANYARVRLAPLQQVDVHVLLPSRSAIAHNVDVLVLDDASGTVEDIVRFAFC
ncbi:MAG: hypothetical protein MHM6MM_005513 [Cercozoa sp. M6MM]